MTLPSERNDVLVDGRAPRNLRKALLAFGGTNPYGEASYRLVRAEKIMILLGNKWTDWPEGTPIEEQDGLCFSEDKIMETVISKIKDSGQVLKSIIEMPSSMEVSQTQPLRRVAEMRLVKRYPNVEGWMLQHWDPPVFYGSRTWWESQTVPGHPELMTLGPFPEQGRYEQTVAWTTIDEGQVTVHGALLRELPSIEKMEEAIQDHEQKMANRFASPDSGWNRLIAINERMQIEQAEQKKYREYCTLKYRDKTKLLMGTSLAAGRLRSEAAKRAGITSHCGN